MSYHPYQAPNSDLTPLNQPAPVRPRVVNLACIAFILSMLLSLVDLIPDLARGWDEGSRLMRFFEIVVIVILYGLFFGVIYAIAKGKNWARWLMLVLTALGQALAFLPDESPAKAQLFVVIAVIAMVLDWFACALLFLGPGRSWFVSRKEPQ
ncbi:MAG: hypothetical protein RL748_1496 [Pseudomonadota bacterium]|jgi:hypothetical protein